MAVNPKGMMITVIMIVITIVIIMQFVGQSSQTLSDSAVSASQSNNCTDYASASCNGTVRLEAVGDDYCSYDNDSDSGCPAGKGARLPLASLVSPTGVALLIVMASVLLFIIGLVIKNLHKK